MAFLSLVLDDWEEVGAIGRGTYAVVSLHRHKKTGQEVAFKRFTLRGVDDRYELDFMKEISILGTLDYPSIIKFYGFACPRVGDEMHLSYAFEYMANGSLGDILTDIQLGIEFPHFGPTERMIVIAGVGAALWHCHHGMIPGGSIIHRDVKAGNVLLDEHMRPRLADFGFAKLISGSRPNTPCRGSWPWMAPEVMLSGDYGVKADVYSFGMFLYEIVTGMTPFAEFQNWKEVAYAVTVRNDRPVIPPPALRIHDVIRRCWGQKPEHRPDMDEVMLMIVTETMALPGTDMGRLLEYICEIGWVNRLKGK
jgi:serine/threonine protein kinase